MTDYLGKRSNALSYHTMQELQSKCSSVPAVRHWHLQKLARRSVHCSVRRWKAYFSQKPSEVSLAFPSRIYSHAMQLLHLLWAISHVMLQMMEIRKRESKSDNARIGFEAAISGESDVMSHTAFADFIQMHSPQFRGGMPRGVWRLKLMAPDRSCNSRATP